MNRLLKSVIPIIAAILIFTAGTIVGCGCAFNADDAHIKPGGS